ncbi:MAG: hypothetical protein ACP6IS_12545, partial [Candidatus Asgardarchaeia archaeon]
VQSIELFIRDDVRTNYEMIFEINIFQTKIFNLFVKLIFYGFMTKIIKYNILHIPDGDKLRKITFILIFLTSSYFTYLSALSINIINERQLQFHGAMTIGVSYYFDNYLTISNESNDVIAPILISPENACIIEEHESITFRWADVTKAENYTLQIDTSKYFNSSNLIEIRGINDTKYTLKEGLSFGRWYWRVCAIFKDGQVSYSKIRCINVLSHEIPKPSFWEGLLLGWRASILVLVYLIAVLLISDYFSKVKSSKSSSVKNLSAK